MADATAPMPIGCSVSVRTFDHREPGVSGVIPEGPEEIFTVVRLQLPKERRRPLACINIIENIMSSVRRVCRNIKCWRYAGRPALYKR